MSLQRSYACTQSAHLGLHGGHAKVERIQAVIYLNKTMGYGAVQVGNVGANAGD